MTKVAIVSIGEELLTGRIVNSNAAWIASHLLKLGLHVELQMSIGDDREELFRFLKDDAPRFELVMVTGGLGPTLDDITKPTFAEYFNRPLTFDENLYASLLEQFSISHTVLHSQAEIPKGTQILPNPLGTASGLVFETDTTVLICMPGVPSEMKKMMEEPVLEYLQKKGVLQQAPTVQTLQLCLITENGVDADLRTLQGQYPLLKIGIYPAYALLSIVLMGRAQDVLEAQGFLKEKYRTYLLENPDGLLYEEVKSLFISQKKTLSIAESCTGGALMAELTRGEGSSEYLMGGVVAYQTQLKESLISVKPATIKKHTVYSLECVQEMLEGLLQVTGSDFGIAVSGVLGPDPQGEALPGNIWIGIQEKNHSCFIDKIELPFDRAVNRLFIVNLIQSYLIRYLRYKIPPFEAIG